MKASAALVAMILFVGAIVMAIQGQGEISATMAAFGVVALIVGWVSKE